MPCPGLEKDNGELSKREIILIVDDDVGILGLYQMPGLFPKLPSLNGEEQPSYTVEVVQTVGTAREFLQKYHTNMMAFITDNSISKKGANDGFELGSWVGENFKGMPVIMISAKEADRQMAQQHDIHIHIKKPFNINEISFGSSSLLDVRRYLMTRDEEVLVNIKNRFQAGRMNHILMLDSLKPAA